VARRRGRLSPAGARRPGRLRGRVVMRAMFVTYLMLIAVGLAYFITIGLLHN
jgi:hypothetical protein